MRPLKSALLVAVVVSMPMTTSAATVSQRENIRLSSDAYNFNAGITPIGEENNRYVFTFTALDDFKIDGFDLSMFGNVLPDFPESRDADVRRSQRVDFRRSRRVDVRKSRYNIMIPGVSGWPQSGRFSVSELAGTASITGATVQAGDVFRVIFATKSDNPISFSTSFTTSPVPSSYEKLPVPAPVPVPASGMLLFAALGGIAAMRRRKKAAV